MLVRASEDHPKFQYARPLNLVSEMNPGKKKCIPVISFVTGMFYGFSKSQREYFVMGLTEQVKFYPY